MDFFFKQAWCCFTINTGTIVCFSAAGEVGNNNMKIIKLFTDTWGGGGSTNAHMITQSLKSL